ncbi:hypothetical protein EXIGLDRAFT_721938 [Exidia glandulosa HHB12029]|uniref:Uncharacterized protein n=1 Tax=Exidia glandulosa HHB12029 TaxID=1314781 RepID=A0A165N9H9_EXIGL|nr:hypothetical protein EXIGLDRAFT_721938 [Exidia glandulosa HHB12029]
MVHHKRAALALATLGLVAAAPIHRREVPQEHSHEAQLRVVNTFLKKNNPDGIVDAVFALLGNAAAQNGIGNFAGGPDCLQTGVADRAFTNAKAEGDIDGMTNALIFRAVERNTGQVGLKSVLCTQFTPVNPEIAALTQHQDPASDGAAATNKAITLELARQIASIGGNPQDALKAGTFAPGNLGDNTARGNTCDDAGDAAGCIFSQNLIVFDATADEINAAVSGVSSGNTGNTGNTGSAGNTGSDTTGNNTGANTGAGSKNQNVGTCAVDGGAAAPPPPADTTTVATTTATTETAAPPAQTATPPAAGSLDFGSCTDPTVIFGAGLDGRKATEFSFLPNNLQEFNHGSALNPDIIYQFQCDTLVNKCGFKREDAIFSTCQDARTQAVAVGRTGASADLFNKLLGFSTNFAAVDTSAPAATTAAPPAAGTTTAAPAAGTTTVAAPSTGALDFGSCSNPSIQFGAGLDGRGANEFSFQAVNLQDFNHGSALNSGVITDFICLQFINKCGLKDGAPAITACRAGKAAADALGKVGAAADAFNKAMGFSTNFAAVSTTPAASAPAASAPAVATPAAPGSLSFGSCTDPSVIFGAGLDGRKATEFSFLPHNLQEFSHGSALNPDIIYQFQCDTLVNKCGFKQSDGIFATCQSARTQAVAVGRTGASADLFNKLLGFSTNFAALDTAAAPAPASSTAAAPAAGNTAVATPAAGGALDFGSCSNPSIQFGAGLDGRGANEFSFQAVNLKDFNHGSALNSGVITDFICLQFINKCGLKDGAPAITACRAGKAAADALGKVGAAADAFNKAMGFSTNFAAVKTN